MCDTRLQIGTRLTMTSGCILVVDDDASLGRALRRMVRSMDIDCEVSSSGDEMLARLPGLRPTMVLLDIHMPEKSGIESLQEMRLRGFDVPTVMMTGVEREGTRATCLSAGAIEVLAKPIDAGAILQLFNRLGGERSKG
jgi:DNA-binding response OmpR family regulator